MIDGKFDVVFRGQTIRNMDLNEVKGNLAKLFKSSAQAVEKLFTGEEVVVKRSLDYSTAMKYQSALKKAGALALIKEIEQVEPVLASKSDGKAVFGAKTETQTPSESPLKSPSTQSTSHGLQTEYSVSTSEKSNSTSSAISNSPAVDLKDISADQVTLAEVGSQLLPDKIYEKREVDTSELSLAGVGERLMPPKAKENHPVPSIDHLSMEN